MRDEPPCQGWGTWEPPGRAARAVGVVAWSRRAGPDHEDPGEFRMTSDRPEWRRGGAPSQGGCRVDAHPGLCLYISPSTARGWIPTWRVLRSALARATFHLAWAKWSSGRARRELAGFRCLNNLRGTSAPGEKDTFRSMCVSRPETQNQSTWPYFCRVCPEPWGRESCSLPALGPVTQSEHLLRTTSPNLCPSRSLQRLPFPSPEFSLRSSSLVSRVSKECITLSKPST